MNHSDHSVQVGLGFSLLGPVIGSAIGYLIFISILTIELGANLWVLSIAAFFFFLSGISVGFLPALATGIVLGRRAKGTGWVPAWETALVSLIASGLGILPAYFILGQKFGVLVFLPLLLVSGTTSGLICRALLISRKVLVKPRGKS